MEMVLNNIKNIKKENGDLYSQIGYFEPAILPITLSAIGYTVAGMPGIIAFGSLSIADEILVSYGYYEKHYVTSGLLGFTIKSQFSNELYTTGSVAGFVGGMLSTSGKLDGYREHCIAPMVGAISGYKYSGYYGAKAGFVIGVADELCVSTGLYTQHYLTQIMIGELFVQSALPKVSMLISKLTNLHPAATNLMVNIERVQFLPKAVEIAVVSYFVKQEDPIINFINSTKFINDSYDQITKIIDQKDLDQMLEKQILFSISTKIISQSISLKLVDTGKDIMHCVETMDRIHNIATIMNDFKGFMTTYIGLLSIMMLELLPNSVFSSYFSSKINYKISDNLRSYTLNKELLLRLLSDADMRVIVDNLSSDINNIIVTQTLETSYISSIVAAFQGFSILSKNNAFDFIEYSILFSTITKQPSLWFMKQSNNYTEALQKEAKKINDISQWYKIKANMEYAESSGSVELIHDAEQRYVDNMRSLSQWKNLWQSIKSLWGNMEDSFKFFFNYALVIDKLSSGALDFGARSEVLYACDVILGVTSIPQDIAINHESVKQSLQHVKSFFARVENIEGHKEKHKIKYGYYREADDVQIEFKDLKIIGDSGLLFDINHLTLSKGVYAITGASGSGKSRLLLKIKGLETSSSADEGSINFKGISSSEEIFYLSQDRFDIPTVSILDGILPKGENRSEADVTKIKNYLKDLGEARDIALNETYNDNMSGGQYIRTKIVSMIMKKESASIGTPKIIMLDQPFQHLDAKSREKAQKALKETHFPDAIILVIDHNAEDNNVTGFYDTELHLENSSITCKSLSEDVSYICEQYL